MRPSNHVSLGTSFPTPHFNNVDSFVSNRGQPSTDFKKLDALVHQLKGSSSSIGAHRVHRVCISFRNSCEEQNVEGCLKNLQQVTQEYYLVKSRLEALFKMEQQILAAGG
ncbi:hypothetical protein ACSQ67_015046 [Phaseolus vulgaris]